MSGHYDDPSKWRATTDGGTKYKILEMDGEFEDDSAAVNWSILIQPRDLLTIVGELFPAPQQIGNVFVRRTAPLPGLPVLRTRKLKFKSHIPGKPIDPFGFDSTAPSKTYGELIRCDIEFAPMSASDSNENDPADPEDPYTFLEVSGNAMAEFLYMPPKGTTWRNETNPNVVNDENASDPNNPNNDNRINRGIELGSGPIAPPGSKSVITEDSKNRDSTAALTVMVPQTEWTLKWKQIPSDFFRLVLVHRLRAMMGRVNSVIVPFLFNAYPETLLFMGYNLRQNFSWRADLGVQKVPLELELKFIEKRIYTHTGMIVGHNHFWKPGFGWSRLVFDPGGADERFTYRYWNFNTLFDV